MLLTTAAVLWLGCTWGSDPFAVPEPDLTAAQTACATDGDCVAVELGCCNHCNGGRVVAVAQKHAAKVKQSFGQSPCEISCTQRTCRPAGVQCVSGACALTNQR